MRRGPHSSPAFFGVWQEELLGFYKDVADFLLVLCSGADDLAVLEEQEASFGFLEFQYSARELLGLVFYLRYLAGQRV
jgi:hypothetical protein